MSRAVAALLLLAAACGHRSELETTRFAQLVFNVPDGWTRSERTLQTGLTVGVWTPNENERKETIAIVRSQRAPATAHGGQELLLRYLAQAYTVGTPSKPIPLSTKGGFVGARIDADFVPENLNVPYRRTHVVLIDGDSLIHIFYTARSADPNLEAFTTILNSVRSEAAHEHS